MSNRDSQVVDALHDGAALERVLRELGCDTAKDNGAPFDSPAGFIHCPNPDHPDNRPSCTVRAAQGLFACHSRCETILPLDLVVAHGVASDRAGAAKWVEQLLDLAPTALPPQRPVIDDPSLTVAQYLAMKGLPPEIATLFQLQDVRVWHPGVDRGTRDAAYETGWYNAVFLPTRPGRRPRIRSDAPDVKLKWAPKVRFHDGSLINFTNDAADPTSFNYPLDVIGMDQLAVAPTSGRGEGLDGRPLLIVVEGESDTHALHAMGLPCVVGVPGSKMPSRVAAELLHACIKANHGDTNLAPLTVVTWAEPGEAGSAFPRNVESAIKAAALEQGFPAPQFLTLHHSAVHTAPKDPAALLLDRPIDTARATLIAALDTLLSSTPITAPIGVQPAGPAATTPPYAPPTAELSAVTTTAKLPAGATAVDPADLPTPRPGAGALWSSFDELGDPPSIERAPDDVEGIECSFVRTDGGWSMRKLDKDGDPILMHICTPFVVERVERCAGEILIRVAAPFGGAWNRMRMEMGNSADAGRTCARLGSIGVRAANRQRPAVTDLLQALTSHCEASLGAVHVPSGTGWSGRPGSSPFGGIDVEPLNDFGARMFEANLRRRSAAPDTPAAAQKWWAEGVAPLIAPPATPAPTTIAPLLALGAAAAAPLVGPLSEVGVSVAPVVWIAGLGGGGKSVTQKLAASIFAPSLPDLDGQSAYFANANMSQAALSARVDSCRDLPLILDDVTQLPPLPGSTSRGDAAKIEAAAALGMLVFNRKPIERATRDGGIRATKAFRSSALFSAEVSMSSESSKAVVTAGHRRRISTIECQPMTERGLTHTYAERVNYLSQALGGAPGELLVAQIQACVAAQQLRGLFDQARAAISALPQASGVTLTQRESLAVSLLGFALLAQVCGESFDEALAQATHLLGPYLEAGAGEGGATLNSDLSGVDAALRSVDDLRATHPTRFDNQARDDAGLYLPPPTAGYLGKEIRPLHDGTRRIALLRSGMEALSSRYGVSMQVVEQAKSDGVLERKQIRMGDGTRAYAMVWMLAPDTGPDEDHDPTLPPGHDPDPHGLNQAPAPERVHVPGARREPAEPTLDESLADLQMWIACNYERMVDGMDARFSFGSGLYVVGDGPACRVNESVLTMVRREARQELEALQMQYRHAAEANPEYVVDVLPFPADEDPRWAHIDAVGPEQARAQWVVMQEALWARNQQTDLQAKRAGDEAYVKAYRVMLMCRYRHPEWFIQGTQVA